MKKMTIEDSLNENGYHLATVVGDSMMPLLRNRQDLVKIIPVSGKLKKYDLPLYKRPTGEYVLHRIIKVKRDCYITCGDNRFLKEKVPFCWVIGVADIIYKDGKEIPVNDSRYIRYVKKMCRSFQIRRIKRKLKSVIKKRAD